MGHLIVNGLFDGEHYWYSVATQTAAPTSSMAENFNGLLVGIFKPEKLKVEYERMNRDMAAEIARRYPIPA